MLNKFEDLKTLYRDRRKIIKNRADSIKEIANQLNAEYYRGYNNIRERFKLSNGDLKDGNFILGNIDGYDYCFAESLTNDNNRWSSIWLSKIIIKPKIEKLPELQLITKKHALLMVYIQIFTFTIVAFMPAISLHENYKIAFYILLVIISIPSLIAILSLIISLLNIVCQNKYKIYNKKFRERYAILSKHSPTEIREFFSDEICSIIANDPTNFDFSITKNYIVSDFYSNEQLSLEKCKEKLNNLLNIIKIYESKKQNEAI